MYQLMTAGPTRVSQDVLDARSKPFPNPDQDHEFVELYHDLCGQISELLGSRAHETLILGGEGILGLEAAIATLTEPGDRVLVLDNGLFGAGFADFVRMYGGDAVVYTCDYRNPIDPAALRTFLEKDHAFKYATLVHCDTPSGMLNDIASLCPLLKEFGILTVVDAVASMFGEPLDVNNGIDVVCGGSQKVLSAPPGLAFVTISPKAWQVMQERRAPVASFYANLLTFQSYYEDKWFPYTMPASDLLGLSVAISRIAADKTRLTRHATLAAACRKAMTMGGLTLHPEHGFANTVTAFFVPDGLRSDEIVRAMQQEHGIMISSSFGPFAGKLLRIGHMGENCKQEAMVECLFALQSVLTAQGFSLKTSLSTSFLQELE